MCAGGVGMGQPTRAAGMPPRRISVLAVVAVLGCLCVQVGHGCSPSRYIHVSFQNVLACGRPWHASHVRQKGGNRAASESRN